MSAKRGQWKERRDGSGRQFSGSSIGAVRVEVYPSLIDGDWFATVTVGRQRWTTHAPTELRAKRAALVLAKALGRPVP